MPIAVDQRATVQPTRTSAPSRNAAGGVTVADYAAAKGLPVAFLKACGISEFTYDQKPALRVPYLGAGGEELAVRFRIGLDGDRFRWKSGARPCLYGLHRLQMRNAPGRWFWSKASPTATRSGSMELPRLACRALPIGGKSVMRGT